MYFFTIVFLTIKNTFKVSNVLFSQYVGHKSGKTDCTILYLWSSGLKILPGARSLGQKILPGTRSVSPSEYDL